MADSNSLYSMPGSPGWIRPGEVMKCRNLKAKKRALEARMSASQTIQILMPIKSKHQNSSRNGSLKRRNPFKCGPNKSLKLDLEEDSSENSSDATFFQRLNSKSKDSFNKETKKCTSFSEAFKLPVDNVTPISQQGKCLPILSDVLNVDWSLKTKLRFFSPKPLPWKQTLKSVEEASGTTSFVRCLSSDPLGRRIDTSANTQFYESCLVWQHPSLPTINAFPRDKRKITGHTGLYGTDTKIASDLLAEWSDSLRSLYQLLRVRMCPYFYVCCHSFTVLFRAAGVAGVSHAHALITPTTRGFRDAMKKDGVEFSMPMFNEAKDAKEQSIVNNDEDVNSDEEDPKSKDNEKQEPSSFLETLGLDSSQFPSLCQSRIKQESKKFRGIDGSSQSLVYVEDMELQGFINFLLNCNSCVVTTGELAGVPPTLLAPTAFHGAVLKSLKISANQVRNAKGELQHSMEIRGPILPTTVLHMTSLLTDLEWEQYSVSLSNIPSTLSFSSFEPPKTEVKSLMAFASGGLVDCGLGAQIIESICASPDEDSIEELPRNYKEITYENKKYHWTDQ